MKKVSLALGALMAGIVTAHAQELSILTLTPPDTPAAHIQDDVIAAFEAKTGAKVKLTVSTDEVPELFETSVLGGKQADIIFVNLVEGTVDWVKNGLAVPADQYLDAWGLRDRINPDALAQWASVDGTVSGVPYYGFVWPVWYNMDLLAKAGIKEVPTSTDELLKVAKTLRDAGIAPFVAGGNDWSGQKLFMQIAQSFMSPDETRTVFSKGGFCANANAMKGLDLFVQLRDGGVFVDDAEGYTADQMNATFYEGQAAMMSAGSWAFTDAPTNMTIRLGGFPVPAGGTYSKPTALQGWTGSGFWISANGVKKLDLVKEYITAWYEPSVAARLVSEANQPVAVILEGKPDIKNRLLAFASTDLKAVVDFAVMPDTAVPGSMANSIIRETSLAFAPGSDAKAICESLDNVYAQ